MDFEIRVATPEDTQSISLLMLALAEKYVTHEYSRAVAAAFLNSISEPEIARKLTHGFTYYVAISGAVVAGVLGMDNMHIYHLFVAEKYQNTGVARQLLLTVQAAFGAQGLTREFTVNSSVSARGFYEKMGFVVESDPQERNGILAVPMRSMPEKLPL